MRKKSLMLAAVLAAGVMMARQGLPAILSKENEKLIPYWEREIKENPKLLGIVERDVNNAVETIDNLVAKRKVDYESIRGQLPGKTMEKPSKCCRNCSAINAFDGISHIMMILRPFSPRFKPF